MLPLPRSNARRISAAGALTPVNRSRSIAGARGVPARRRMSRAHRSGTALTPSKREQVLMCRDPRHKTAGPIACETVAITPAAPGPLIAKTPTISSLMAGVATCRSRAPKCSETTRPRRRTGSAIAPRRIGMRPRRTAPARAAPEARDRIPAIGALGSAPPIRRTGPDAGGKPRCPAGAGLVTPAWRRADPRWVQAARVRAQVNSTGAARAPSSSAVRHNAYPSCAPING